MSRNDRECYITKLPINEALMELHRYRNKFNSDNQEGINFDYTLTGFQLGVELEEETIDYCQLRLVEDVLESYEQNK